MRYFNWNGSSWINASLTDQTEIGDPGGYGVRMLYDDITGKIYVLSSRHPSGSRTAQAWMWTSVNNFSSFDTTQIEVSNDDNFWYPTELIATNFNLITFNRRTSLIHGERAWFRIGGGVSPFGLIDILGKELLF